MILGVQREEMRLLAEVGHSSKKMNPRTIGRVFVGAVREADAWGSFFVTHVPGRIGIFGRRLYFRAKLGHLGPRLYSEVGVDIRGWAGVKLDASVFLFRGCMLSAEAGKCSIGDGSAVGRHAIIDGSGGEIQIGRNVMIAGNVVVRASNHRFADSGRPMQLQGHEPGRIIIEDDVWIGAHCVILSGVTIGKGCVVAANSTVVKDIPQGMVVGGNPAEIIRDRHNP